MLVLAGCAAHHSSVNATNVSNATTISKQKNITRNVTVQNRTVVENATKPVTKPLAPSTKSTPPSKHAPIYLSEANREQLAVAFLEQLQNAYHAEEWHALYGLLADKQVSEDEFAFFMDVTGYEKKKLYDPVYEFLAKSWTLDPALGTSFTVINLSFDGENATAVINMTYGGIHVQHRPFLLRWEGDRWRVTFESLLNGKTGETICANSGMSAYCFSQYAGKSDDIDYCARSGEYIVACYAQFNAKVPTSTAVTVCSGFPTRSAADECLKTVALSTHDPLLCDAVTIPTNEYECLGIVDLDDCLAAVDQSADTAETFTGVCYFGSAKATHNASLCKNVPNTGDLLKQQCLRATS